MDGIIHWTSKKSIEILLIVMATLTVIMFSTANLSFAKSKADSPDLPMIIALQHIPRGEANLQWSTTHTLVVTVTVVGLEPNSTHLATIQQGPDDSFANCNSPIRGKTIYNLNPLKADKFGKANSVTTTIDDVSTRIPDSGWYLAVFNDSQLSTNSQQIRIACGEIAPGGIPHGFAPPVDDILPTSPSPIGTPTTKDQSVHVDLTGSADANQSVVGNAAVSLNNTLTVRISLGNLAPNSKNAASIHKGTCDAQGPIVFPLNDVNADKNGQSSSITIINSVPTSSISSLPWYINVYGSSSNNGSKSQTGGDAIACGNFSEVTALPAPPK